MLKKSIVLAFGLILLSGTAHGADLDRNKQDDSGLKIRTTGSAAIGYNSNAEDEVDGEGDWFHEHELGLRATREIDDLKLEVNFEGEARRYFEETAESNWSYEIGGKAEYEFSKNTSMSLEAAREYEDDAGDEIVIHTASLAAEDKNDLMKLRSSIDLEHEDNVLPESDSDNEYDFVKVSSTAKAEFMPDHELSPYVKVGFGLVRHPSQAGSTVNRNAREASASAGVTYRIEEELEASAGVSHAVRDFEAAGVKTRTAPWLEAELTWTPAEELELTASLGRSFKEPTEAGSYVRDAKEFELAVTAKPMESYKNRASLEVEFENERGAGIKSRDIEFTNRASYEIMTGLTVFAEGSQSWKREKDSTAGTTETKRATEGLIGFEAEL